MNIIKKTLQSYIEQQKGNLISGIHQLDPANEQTPILGAIRQFNRKTFGQQPYANPNLSFQDRLSNALQQYGQSFMGGHDIFGGLGPNVIPLNELASNIAKEAPKPNNLNSGLSDMQSSVFHNTDYETARSLIRGSRYSNGMNVSSTPDLALGQSGQGVTLEIDKNAVRLSPLRHKSGLDFAGAQQGLPSAEYEVINAPSELNSAVKSVTFDTPLKDRLKDKFFGLTLTKEGATPNVDRWKTETMPDGKVRYINPDYSSESQMAQ